MSRVLFPGREEWNLGGVTRADVAVGILGGGPPELVARKGRQVEQGLREFFPHTNWVVILGEDRPADAGGEVFLHGPVEAPREVRSLPLETFEFPALMWTLSLFAFALAHKAAAVDVGSLTQAFFPLYLGRTCSTTLSMAHMNPRQAEVYLEDQCRVFEETKPYLERLWVEG